MKYNIHKLSLADAGKQFASASSRTRNSEELTPPPSKQADLKGKANHVLTPYKGRPKALVCLTCNKRVRSEWRTKQCRCTNPVAGDPAKRVAAFLAGLTPEERKKYER